jgi:hypothetical protein
MTTFCIAFHESYLSTGDRLGILKPGKNPWFLHTVYRTVSWKVSGAALLIKYDGAQCARQKKPHIIIQFVIFKTNIYLTASQINNFALVFEFYFYLFLYESYLKEQSVLD